LESDGEYLKDGVDSAAHPSSPDTAQDKAGKAGKAGKEGKAGNVGEELPGSASGLTAEDRPPMAFLYHMSDALGLKISQSLIHIGHRNGPNFHAFLS
jgi:hypothetical protein